MVSNNGDNHYSNSWMLVYQRLVFPMSIPIITPWHPPRAAFLEFVSSRTPRSGLVQQRPHAHEMDAGLLGKLKWAMLGVMMVYSH